MNLDPSLRAIFNEALDRRDAAERARYLDEACGADAALRERVENLLRADGDAGGFFSDPTSRPQSFTPDAATLICSPPVTEKAGDRIGHYKLLQQIGEGGCGVVYMAEQEEPVRRRVALKVIKLGMDTKHVVARFEAERQALALMDHPNIAQVFDAGATDSGRPFFVMELVRGVKITEFCDDKKLSTQERLDLFRQVCAAIQHAHQKGIIHRDLKPSNILVTMIDGAAVPKVIDFGIAKATNNQPLTDKTLFTAFEQFIGTPAYMSPEQAEMSGVDVDTRTDIYSLGVVLYELLTGRTPFDSGELLRGGLDEIRRTIREQEPPKPSTRLHALAQADLTTVAQARHTDAPKLVHQVRGDLDWVVMKCLEKDRNRRYETVNGLAMDVQRHLHNEPVAARPPTGAYRLQKLVRRNKLAFAAASAVTAALVIGLGISTWMFFKEKQARERAVAAEKSQSQERKKAETEAAKSQQVAQFLKNMLNGVGPSVARGRDIVMLREILDNTAGQVGKDMKDQPLVEAELRRTIGVVYFALGQYEKAEAMHRDALRLRKSLLGETNTLVADSLNDLADAVEARGEFARAEAMYREALALRKRLLGERHPDVATSLHSLALALYDQHKLAEAETMNRQALAMRRELRGNSHLEVASSLTSLALVLRDLKKPAEAETLYREALATQKQLQGNESPQIAATLNGLANVLNDQDNMFNDQAKLAEAESSYREALAMRRKMLGNEHPGVAIALTSLANLLKRQNKPAEAEALYREALAIRRKLFGNEHLQVIKLLDPLASVLRAQRKWAEAETLHREAIAHYEKLAANSPNLLDYWQQLARNHHQLGLLLQNDGRKPEAEVELRKAQELWRQHPDPAVDLAKKAAETQPNNIAESSWANVFIIYYNAGEWENCLWAIKKHEQVRSANGGGQSGWEWLHEAMAHWQLDHQEEARKWFYKSIGWMDDVQESRLRERQAEAAALLGLPDPGERSGKAAAYLKQGHAWQQQGEIEKAREAYGQAIGIYESLAADFPRVPAYQKKLIDLLTRAGRPQAAEKIYRQLESVIREELATRRKLLGNEHLDVAATLRDLADVLQCQGKSAEAEAVWREELAVRRKLFGNEHLEVAQALSNLSFWFRDHGNLPEAETTARELLAIRKKLLGNEHADVAQSLHLLAWNLNLAGKHTEAERLSREEVSMWRKLLGNEHPNVAWALGDLTTFLRDQGKLSEAETTIRESLAIRQKRLANNHPDVINSLNLLADLLRAQGKLAEVETLYREELAQQRAVRGSDSPAVAETLSSLAASLQSQGKLAEAEKMFREAMEIILKLRDQNLARLPALVRRLVDVLKAQGKSQDAEKLYEETIQAARQTLGESDPALGELLHEYGEFLFFHQGRFAAAAEQYIKSLPIRRARQDDDLAWTLRNLGFVLLRAAKPKEAEPYLRESLALHHKLHPQEDTYGTAEPTERLADSLYQQRKLPQAEQVYREALVAYAKTQGCGGVGHTRVAQSLVRLLMSENKLTEAETFLKDLLSQQRQSPDDRPVAVTSTLLELANVLKTQNKSEEAANRFREALEIASTFRADMTNASPLNEVAWQLVTAENPTSWDVAVAVELAQKAVAATSRKTPDILDTLAAGYAAAGQFTNAVRVQQEAIALLTNDVSKVDFASRLKLYESNTPYRDHIQLAESDKAEVGQKVAAPKP